MNKKSKIHRLADIVRFSCSQSLRRDIRQKATRPSENRQNNATKRRDKNYLTIMNDEYFKEIGFIKIQSQVNGLAKDDKNKTTSKCVKKQNARDGWTAHQTGKNKTSLLLILLVSSFLLVFCLSCRMQKVHNTGEYYEPYQEEEIKYHKT